LTQASSVKALVRCSDVESATLTDAFVPLKLRASPNLPLPAPAQLTFVSVPVLPFPDWSATVVPLPASKPYAATRPVVGGAETVAVAWFEAALTLPAASWAVTL
jgi:hypothetical protein